MKTLACPECHEVMHRVEVVTAKTASVGISQLSRHCATYHVIPSLNSMLEGVASMGLTIEQIIELTEILCPACGIRQVEDTGIYVRKSGRTIQCCSLDCLAVS